MRKNKLFKLTAIPFTIFFILGVFRNVSAQASNKYNHSVNVKHVKVKIKTKYVYTSLSLKHRKRINSNKVFVYSKYIHFNKKHNHALYKYVSSGKIHGWVNTKYVKTIKSVKHKETKRQSGKQYIPNKENIKREFKKLLDPYLVKYGKKYGATTGKMIEPIVDKNGYGSEFVVTSGNAAKSDKEMAKILFNGLLNGTLMTYLEDHSYVSVIIDHIDIDPSDGTIDARLYLTWYSDMSIQPKFEILNGKPVYNY